MQKSSLGEGELELLREVAARGVASAGELAESFGAARGWARTTIHTMLERLRRKGYLTRELVDGTFRYSARLPQDEVLTGLVRRFMEQTLGGSLQPFAAYLADARDVSAEELDALRQAVATLEARVKGGGDDAA